MTRGTLQMWLELTSLRGEDFGLSRGQSNPKSFKVEFSPAAENQRDDSRRRNCCLWKWRWLAMSKGMQVNSRSQKEQGNGFFLKPLERKAALLHLDFSPVRSPLDFWPTELQNNKFVFFQVIQFLVICYSSNETKTHEVFVEHKYLYSSFRFQHDEFKTISFLS